jgi:hypothetical protein
MHVNDIAILCQHDEIADRAPAPQAHKDALSRLSPSAK